MTLLIYRRAAIISSGVAIATGAAALASPPSQAAEADLIPPGARTLSELNARLAKAPRRRDFKTVPMILNDPSQWDHEALSEVMAYKGAPKQAFDNSDIAAPWLNLMRNALNGQIWSFRHPDCLVVSATHGTAHLALYDQAMWDKYQLSTIAGDKFKTNTLILKRRPAAPIPRTTKVPKGRSPRTTAQFRRSSSRGVVFLACHNAMWELSEKLIAAGVNPDKLTPDAMAAEFTNHLIPDVVVTPGIVATLPELQRVGFFYNK